MRRLTLSCLALLLLIAYTMTAELSAAADPHTIAWRSDFDKARAEAKARNLPVLVQFTGPWCSYCRWSLCFRRRHL